MPRGDKRNDFTLSADKTATMTDRRKNSGRNAQERGKSFESQVAEAYRLLRYEVDHSRTFSGRQVDLFLTGRFGDLVLFRAIECKAARVSTDDVDAFCAKLRLVRREYPSAQGTIISGTGFSDGVKAHALTEGIQLTLYRDLAAQLFDGHAYANTLIKECEENDRYPLGVFVESNVGNEIAGPAKPAFKLIHEWLSDPNWQQLTLLGDVGIGKTFLSRMVAYRLAKAFLEKPFENPVPVRIDLRHADREFTLEGLVVSHFAKMGLHQVAFDIFQRVLSDGNMVLILDGFDEMAARVTAQITRRNFFELARAVQGRAKVLLTCRTHYFTSRSEEEEVILGTSTEFTPESARDLYWDLINRKGFRATHLRPFEMVQIEEYVRRSQPRNSSHVLQKIRSVYNLVELSQRPMLLEMIVKSIDKLQTGSVEHATLYGVFTDAWVHRDSWREVLSPQAKLAILTALARSLWENESTVIHYTKLSAYLQKELSSQIKDPRRFLEIDHEIRTASFLIRDDSGHFGFAHKSYGEYFLARHLATELNAHRLDCLRIRRLIPEVIGFLAQMARREEVEPFLEAVLTGTCQPILSENSLLCLYGFRRDAAIKKGESIPIAITLPSNANLQGAVLDQISLDGAVFQSAQLDGAILSEMSCTAGNLRGASLINARLDKANLTRSDLRGAKMNGVLLSGATLDHADLREADLEDANFDDASLINCNLEQANLRGISARGALVPNELQHMLKTEVDVSALKALVQDENQSISLQYSEFLEEIYPQIRNAAARFARYYYVNADELISELALYLSKPQNLQAIRQVEGAARRQHVNAIIRNIGGKLAKEDERFYELDAFSPEDRDIILSYGVEQQQQLSPEDQIILRDLLSRLESTLSEFPPDLADIVIKRIVHDQSIQAIAESTGKSVKTIHRRLAKAREILAERVAGRN